ncbi:DEAD/DEAH box helicase [Motilibacter peucedani]|nr:DEAD/DEAH box helicase [Motilibacter peucedani]
MPQTPAPRSSSSRSTSFRPGPSRSGRPGGPRRGSSSARADRPAPAPSALEQAFAAAPVAPDSTATWAELGLPGRLVTALERRGVTAPFPIQAATLADALAGRDVLGRAKTGSGKTLAFGLPLLARLAELREVSAPSPGRPRALVLVPTRELAVQVRDALDPLGAAVRLRSTAIFGGASIGRQINALERGVDLIVATPGRLQDLMERGACSLADVTITAIDEADHMSDLGFLPVVLRLLGQTRPDGQRLLFSATLDGAVETVVTRYLHEPALHAVASADSHVELMDHRAFVVSDQESKMAVLTEISGRPARSILFVRTKHGADRLATKLERSGVQAAAIHGDLRQNARQRALDDFSAGRTRVLVATDVAARGIHVDDVDLVVHVDQPNDHKDYLHRSGRTARAGNSGVVLSLLLPSERRGAEQLRRRANVDAEVVDVAPGHPAVRALAESGEPVVVQPLPERSESSRDARFGAPRRGQRPSGRFGEGRDSRPGRAHPEGPSRSARPRRDGRPAGDAGSSRA